MQSTMPTRMQNSLAELSLRFDELMSGISYVGPLRDRPQRSYQVEGKQSSFGWAAWREYSRGNPGGAPPGKKMGRDLTQGRPYRSFEKNLGYWLKRLEMIDEFAVEEIASGTDLYELRVTVSGEPPEYLLRTSASASPVLPVLVQVFYAPRQSSVILEQPEIHLHPAAQSELGDVLLAAINYNGVQLLVETHSEHLLRRLQRRIAEGEISDEDVALYFVEIRQGKSVIYELIVDQNGSILNWPTNFFGDEIGDLAAMTEAAARRGTRPA